MYASVPKVNSYYQKDINLEEQYVENVISAVNSQLSEFQDKVQVEKWKLSPQMSQRISNLVLDVEEYLYKLIGQDTIQHYPIDDKWQIMDSMDPGLSSCGKTVDEISSPNKGDKQFPRMLIENRFYYSSTFRKIHIEVAYRQDSIWILHFMMYPNTNYQLPIFQFDVIESGGRVSFLAVDLGPVKTDRSLPDGFEKIIKALLTQNQLEPTPRESLPEWGQQIFSELFLQMRPKNQDQVAGFQRYLISLLKVYLYLSKSAPMLVDQDKIEEVRQCHQHLCENHLKNIKTRRMLEASFGDDIADTYMSQVMFKCA
eukprot:TRINITY_DN7392_c0_g1_i3.p1 TRINITY_DN7392_c0_g1~~TRINITY_DN7392_c0_g1_i3.p1  ORF type:complete len:313 (-),score=11.76 TRINITY_DN7392_c0_g1_i3:577-1515(-)